ncbi:hypothetical protein BO78DRAFT_181435 [Aspergillus sclerotiicarbonarius CBS 121057]|uniref:RING-type domain-containing protein n=1 Tax=Aspergillus sclerotiicarbonarius (strain CBS 121057 / IBT 28362) TaxID=1448318 RepID=A0A319ESB5_ASPSB|nr:hypothetical protein BO78DRAFT_181435 [Aspergillus sclerotiicarbonarius CBS 121057]
MWHHRRRTIARRDSELRNLTQGGTMRQVSVERWLEEQTHADHSDRQYAQESCPICLSGLVPSQASSQETLPFPETAHIASSPHNEPDLHDTIEGRNILVLSRCHHVFHASCLTAWFQDHQHKCPICQTAYSTG